MNPFRPRRVSNVDDQPPLVAAAPQGAAAGSGGMLATSSSEQGMFAENVLVARERVIPNSAATTRDREFDAEFADRLEGELQMAYRLAGFLMTDSADAADAVQEASVRAWRGWAGLRERDSFHAWFSQILVNVCRTRLSQRSRRRTVDIEEVDVEAPTDPFKAALARDTVGRALSALSDELRMVVVLRYWGDMSLAEIADRLHIPIGTVKSRHHAALAALRRRVERLEGGPR